MSNTPHELAEEFPEFTEKVRDLKARDAHFARLFDRYHVVNRQVHRAETHVEPVDAFVETDLRKERGALKDDIWAYLKS